MSSILSRGTLPGVPPTTNVCQTGPWLISVVVFGSKDARLLCQRCSEPGLKIGSQRAREESCTREKEETVAVTDSDDRRGRTLEDRGHSWAKFRPPPRVELILLAWRAQTGRDLGEREREKKGGKFYRERERAFSRSFSVSGGKVLTDGCRLVMMVLKGDLRNPLDRVWTKECLVLFFGRLCCVFGFGGLFLECQRSSKQYCLEIMNNYII